MENQPHHHRGDHAEKDMDKRQTAAALAFMRRRFPEMDADQANRRRQNITTTASIEPN